MSLVIYCQQCGNKLAEQRATGSWETRKHKRMAVAPPTGFEELACEECGSVWRLGDGMDRLARPTIRRVA